MGMQNFSHISAKSLDDAVKKIKSYGRRAVAVAGGTDLLGILKDEVHPVYPQVLIDLKTIKGLDFISEESDGIRIGALTTISEVSNNKVISGKYPLLADAANAVASPQLRNMGTIGGNICQEPRCWYYRNPGNTFNCLRKGGEKCHALLGDNRYHSIFGSMRVGVPGCSSTCPDNIDIPRYMESIRLGEIAEAGRIILEKNPMPAITGRICPHLCESSCNRSEKDSAVSIRSVERRVGDYILENTKAYIKSPAKENGKKVAIVGGGPAGLSCAHFLRQNGYGVVIYDKEPKLGGMLRYGIPNFRLSEGVLDKEIDFLLSHGIVAKTSQNLGKDFTLDSLKSEGFDAIFLAMGSWVAKGMRIENESNKNIIPGISFLESVKWNGPPVMNGIVAVVGGGNTAIDAARTALRCGAEKVVLLYRRTQAEMPAEEEEIEEAIKEGVELQFLVTPKKAIVSGDNLSGLECYRMKLGESDSSGRPRPLEIKGSEFLFKADWVISAIGQDQNLLGLDNKSYGDIKLSKKNTIEADPETFQTNVAGVFAGGDVVSGPASAIEAIAAGRKTANMIDAYMSGRKFETEEIINTVPATLHSINEKAFGSSERVNVEELSPQKRQIDIEDYISLNDTKINFEAYRCLDCSCVAVNASDIAPALIALGAMIKTTRRSIAAEDFFTVDLMTTTVLAIDELVTEIFIPTPMAGTKFNFQKFRIRNSIDFPIVSIATALTFDGAKIKAARVVMGAVAPIPLRAVNVEEALIGKIINEETAELAGNVASKQTFPLEFNHYKIQVMKGLIRKALLAEK